MGDRDSDNWPLKPVNDVLYANVQSIADALNKPTD